MIDLNGLERLANEVPQPKVNAETMLALIRAVQAALAYMDEYASKPRMQTADLNPHSLHGRRETLNAALAPFRE